jgi:hypothetical protein
MATLFVRRAGDMGAKAPAVDGSRRRWAVSDGVAVLATARQRLVRDQLDIDAGGRHLTVRMPGMRRWGVPKVFEVVDDSTGEKVIAGKPSSSGRRGNRDQEWALTLPSGGTLSWFYQPEPRKLGFYDRGGAPVMLMGRDPSFDLPAKVSVLRILLRLWGAAIASSARFVVQVEDDAVGDVVTAQDVPILALLGTWLQRIAEAEDPASTGPSS